MTRVVITGVGAVTPLGNDAASSWQGLRAGRSGIGRLDRFDASAFDVRIAGQVRDFRPVAGMSRAAAFGLTAACEAIRDAGAGWWDVDPYRRGAAVGGTVGRPELQELVDMSAVVAAGRFPGRIPAR
ncbi:beta-ketoacyl synthase N-terminal-like domain-containing protein [Actinocrispum wychmicini]|uniref:Beta-ketoacyl synthase-like protein n=1 Tax=Actinocrispum wychmicini TaxID=1213861 RepID=A0A4R2IIF5_9PSEU|nr:beta-ketoacyl synthase N-terminal-like domain-containing protein [Actinocrispum wychmicini]TCO44801.1 beta-ketoacyl synthase-like protein [Actinocrispum wychmicini]